MLHENTLGETYFAPLTEKTVYEKGFKSWDDNVRRALGDIRGEASGTPLAHLWHKYIIALTFTPSLRLMSRRLTLTLLMSS